MTTIGELTTRISIQQKTSVSDGMGGYTDTWSALATVWAKKTTHRSDESVQAMMNTGFAVHNFRIRYRSGIKTSHRVLEGTTYYNIIGPPISVDGKWLDIMVKEATG
jgi:SPP1 family predicted phage head-tail adaptor